MKRRQTLLICVLTMFSAGADSLETRPLPHNASFAASSATGAELSAQTGLTAAGLRGPSTTQGAFADLGHDVVKDMRATSAFVQEQATKAGTPSGWLIALAAFGLVALQLRRKHKSLPQRRIAPYGSWSSSKGHIRLNWFDRFRNLLRAKWLS
jgi:hypothetical protein